MFLLSSFRAWESSSSGTPGTRLTHLKVVAVGVVGTPEEGSRGDRFVRPASFDLLALPGKVDFPVGGQAPFVLSGKGVSYTPDQSNLRVGTVVRSSSVAVGL